MTTPCPIHSDKQAREESGLCLGCEAMLRQPGLSGEARARAREAASRAWLERHAAHQLCESPLAETPEEAPAPPAKVCPPAKACRVHPHRPAVTAGLCQACQASLLKVERSRARLPAEGTATRQALVLCDSAWRERRFHLSALYAQVRTQALGMLRGVLEQSPEPVLEQSPEPVLEQGLEGVLEQSPEPDVGTLRVPTEEPTLRELDALIQVLDAQRRDLVEQLLELRRRRRRLAAAEALLQLHPPSLVEVEEICPEQVYGLRVAYAQLRASLAASVREAGHG